MIKGEYFLLRFSCKDKVGIVSKLSTILSNNNCNIIESKQFTDQATNSFFIRQSFHLPNKKKISYLKNEFAKTADLLKGNYEIKEIKKPINTLIMVSKLDHCLIEIINKIRSKNLNIKISGIISNHKTLKTIALQDNIPFYFFPINDNKTGQEKKIKEYINKNKIELIVLARYMQILTHDFVDLYYGKIINIHHSFLPSFKGSKPYHQAFERGVKIIGATAHFVNKDLDEGPIIEQDVEKVNHELDPNDLISIGRDIETRVLYKAIKDFSEGRIFLNGKKTIVFKGEKIIL